MDIPSIVLASTICVAAEPAISGTTIAGLATIGSLAFGPFLVALAVSVTPAALDLDPSTSGKEGKAFFSEEKKQKTFGPAVAEPPSSCTPGNKSFLVLFFKKEPLALLVTGQDLRPLE